MFLKLSGLIEGQLRDAYAKKYEAGTLNQSSLATKLGVNRSAVHHRLTGRTNMTIETIADMIWGLDHDIELKIFDPAKTATNHTMASHAAASASIADTPLMAIASTAPSSNIAEPQVIGGPPQQPRTSWSPLNYTAALAGAK